jgi:Fur family ferric uptake transcriptional regulator
MATSKDELDGAFPGLSREQNQNLRNLGLRVTLPRALILRMIQESPERHLSAEDVYKKLIDQHSDVGLATVYRVLSQFENAGILIRNVFDSNKAVYEMNEGSHHDHLVCVECGAVHEFTSKPLEDLQKKIAASEGYEPANHQLAIYGYCSDCVKSRRVRGNVDGLPEFFNN